MTDLEAFADEICAALLDICTHLHADYPDFCSADYFIELATHVWMRTDPTKGHNERLANCREYLFAMARWMGTDGLRGLSIGKPLGAQLLNVYDAIRGRVPKKGQFPWLLQPEVGVSTRRLDGSGSSPHCWYPSSDMNTAVVCVSLILLGIVLVGAFRAVFDRRIPFVRGLDKDTWQAYSVIAVTAVTLLAWRFVDLRRIQSFEIAGMKTTLGTLQQKVETLSDQMEAFFKRKKTEIFDRHNWKQVRKVGTTKEHGVILEVTLEQEPIPNSVEVFERVLQMREQDYHIEGRVVRFPANTDKPDDGLTVKYYPRVAVGGGSTQ